MTSSATLASNPGNRETQRMYERWEWSRVGRTPGVEGETLDAFDLYVIALRSAEEASGSR
ncbi:hypothetical protein [Streptosporangium carneum]|uniref:Uncharacterized protein n=1 Tax=Streptosporangium carneum TaxID=47481 RepID=A0A9W6HWC8_9ACTN|nr:hypothetical protein [Streptosporangium carneum]GLK07562.1 hypothetical protein GCM10017600_09670 [Streptosporangium carneum]